MNIKRDKTYQARMDGLKYALEIVERGGIEELKKEIRVRNAHFIPLEVSAKKANEISQVLANRILATFTPTVMFSLNQDFAKAVIMLLSNDEYRNTMGLKGSQFINKNLGEMTWNRYRSGCSG